MVFTGYTPGKCDGGNGIGKKYTDPPQIAEYHYEKDVFSKQAFEIIIQSLSIEPIYKRKITKKGLRDFFWLVNIVGEHDHETIEN